MDATGLLDINLFSLDVEGGELSVLRTLDLEATNIQVVVVELDGRSPEKDEEVGCILSRGQLPLDSPVGTRGTRGSSFTVSAIALIFWFTFWLFKPRHTDTKRIVLTLTEGVNAYPLRPINLLRMGIVRESASLYRRSQVRGLLRRHGFEASPPEWGSIQAACGRNYSCTLNEVFVNPAFERRRASRAARRGLLEGARGCAYSKAERPHIESVI